MFVSFSFIPSEGCPLLEQLNISWCDQVTKDGIQALVRGCGGLKALFLKGCTQVINTPCGAYDRETISFTGSPKALT